MGRPNIQRRTNLIVFRAKQRIMSNKASTTLPAECVADFCIVPIGTVSPSIAPYVEKIEQQLQQGGLQYSVRETGTRLQGSWLEVMNAIGEAHALLHDGGIQRIHTDVRIASRTGAMRGKSQEDGNAKRFEFTDDRS